MIRSISSGVRSRWQNLVVTDILFKLIAFAILAPLFAAVWHAVLAYGADGALSDVDIAKFFAGPFGWLCVIGFGAAWLTIVAMEQAALLYVFAADHLGKSLGATRAIRFAIRHVDEVFFVAARLIGRTLLVFAPFLLIAGAVYVWLLGEFDINYYLNQRPSEFKIAVSLGAALGALLLGILVRLYSGWFLALPLVLFEQTAVGDALSLSRDRIAGNRKEVVRWLLTWLVVVGACNVAIGAAVGLAGRVLIPSGVGSLAVLATRVGLLLLVSAASALVLNLIANIVFAGMLFHGFCELDPDADDAIRNTLSSEIATDDPKSKVLTRTRLVAGCVVAALAAALFGYWAINSVTLEDEVEIMAHRGASFAAPENTMAAFRQAITDGADWIEIDVQETADGEVVVAHDSDFMKLAGNPIKIWDATMEDLAEIDVGSWVDPRFADQRVPTLAQVLQLCRDEVGVNIELKYYGHDRQLEKRVVEIVEAEKMADQVMIMSLKPEGVAKVKSLRPNWRCGLLLSVYVGKMKSIEADFLAVNSKFATRNFVQRAHKLDKDVYVWTVNDAATMSQMLNRKVDGILTDRPKLAGEVLDERSRMSIAERLLSEIAVTFQQIPVVTE